MCCFSQAVLEVSGTQIFARPSQGTAQILVYSMSLQSEQEVSMVLPLPVPPGCPENAVRFINLEAYPEYFTDMDALFPESMTLGIDRSLGEARAPLAVHDVGQFEASFIPSIPDFSRLDPRFRLPVHVWRDLPQYKDWGFAVFKLKKSALLPLPKRAAQSLHSQLFGQALVPPTLGSPETGAEHRVHPMAFEFPRRNPSQLFFPTVHIHDQQVHPTAHFDHQLYFQLDRMMRGMNFPGTDSRDILQRWASLDLYLGDRLRVGKRPIKQYMDIRRAAGTLHLLSPLYHWELSGELPNQDSILEI